MDEDLPTRGLRKANCFDRVTTRTAREDDDGDAEDERLAAAARTATGATMPRDTAPTTIPKRDDGDLRALTATNYSCKMTSSSFGSCSRIDKGVADIRPRFEGLFLSQGVRLGRAG
jgi:hypothetical protein